RLESGQTQRSVSRTLLESPEVLLQGCGIDSRNRNVRHRPGAGRPRATTSTDDRYIQLTARPKQNRECYPAAKTVALGNRTKRVSSQTVRNRLHEGGLSMHVGQCSRIPLTPHANVRPERRWAAEHRDWEQHDWSQKWCFYGRVPISVYSVAADVFLYGGTGALSK
ncbi:hypothetical protein TNCV_2849791, partial [Trichonephila clavipes]